EIGRSSRIDYEVVQDQRQRDDNDLQDERQDQPKEEEVEPKRCKRARTEKLLDLIFKKKMKADGTIDKYKAILEIKGYRQQEGPDDTCYCPIKKWEVHQMDVKITFLNKDLHEPT
ncbi:hypothetical protein Tco_1004406, partial [Tanacetum coccineum]